MGAMKEYDIRIRGGGDDAIAAVNELLMCRQGVEDSIIRMAEQFAGLPRWIPVSESLPPDGEFAIWRNACGALWPCFVGKKDGNVVNWGGEFPVPLGVIDYWMPLPSPPSLEYMK